jgi:hypothetical protein
MRSRKTSETRFVGRRHGKMIVYIENLKTLSFSQFNNDGKKIIIPNYPRKKYWYRCRTGKRFGVDFFKNAPTNFENRFILANHSTCGKQWCKIKKLHYHLNWLPNNYQKAEMKNQTLVIKWFADHIRAVDFLRFSDGVYPRK